MSVPNSHINVTDKNSTQTIGLTNTHLSSLPTPSLTPCQQTPNASKLILIPLGIFGMKTVATRKRVRRRRRSISQLVNFSTTTPRRQRKQCWAQEVVLGLGVVLDWALDWLGGLAMVAGPGTICSWLLGLELVVVLVLGSDMGKGLDKFGVLRVILV